MMLSGRVAPDGYAGVVGGYQGVEQFRGLLIGFDRHHVLAVDHHVADGEFAQVENAADHVAMLALDAAFHVVELDGAADLFMRRQHGVGFAFFLHAEPAPAPSTR